MFDIYDLYRQEFALFYWYQCGRLTKEQYLAYMKPLDKAISELEMARLQERKVLKKASLPHFQRPEH